LHLVHDFPPATYLKASFSGVMAAVWNQAKFNAQLAA
jgi:hypothetical protein